MSRLDVKVQMRLLKEAKEHIKMESKKRPVLLSEEHIMEWLEVFYDDRIMLDGCNHAKIKY